jgi:hypothetical protein
MVKMYVGNLSLWSKIQDPLKIIRAFVKLRILHSSIESRYARCVAYRLVETWLGKTMVD